jgi:hypothetical protein
MTEPTPAATPTGGPTRRRRWIRYAVAGAVIAAIVAAGLGYALTRDADPGFDSPEAIAALLEQRGAPCTDFDAGGDGRADERGACRADGQKIVIATFGSRAEVEAHWERQVAAAADNEAVGMVIGDRWSISGPARAYLRHAAEVLDAEYRAN